MKAEFNFKAVRRALWKAATAVFNVNSTAKFCSSLVGIKTVANFLLQLSSGGETKLQIFSAEDFALNTVFLPKASPVDLVSAWLLKK